MKHLNLPPDTVHHQSEISLLLAAAESEVADKVRTRDTQFRLDLWRFPCRYGDTNRQPIQFPEQTVKSIEDFDYYDADDVLQDLANYTLTSGPAPVVVVPEADTNWPATRKLYPGTVLIDFTAGPTSEQLDIIRLVMMQMVSTWFETRSGAFTGTVSTEMKMSTRDLLDHLDWGMEFFNFDDMHYGS